MFTWSRTGATFNVIRRSDAFGTKSPRLACVTSRGWTLHSTLSFDLPPPVKGLSSLIPARKQKPPVRPRPEQKFVEVAKPEAGLWSLWNSERLEKGRSLPEVVDQCRTRASGAEQQRLGDERPAIEENRQSLTVSRYSRLSLLVHDRSLQRSSPVGGHVKTPFSVASTGNPPPVLSIHLYLVLHPSTLAEQSVRTIWVGGQAFSTTPGLFSVCGFLPSLWITRRPARGTYLKGMSNMFRVLGSRSTLGTSDFHLHAPRAYLPKERGSFPPQPLTFERRIEAHGADEIHCHARSSNCAGETVAFVRETRS